jgi:hypothetical protein
LEKNEKKYPQLNFPPIRLKVRRSSDGGVEVFVPLRGWLVLTPEEWVRRHVVAYLVESKGVPPTSISEEYPVMLNGQPQRADIVAFGPDAKPALLVECKAPDVAIDEQVVAQAVRYNSVVGATHIMVTNGLETKLFEASALHC